MVLIVKNSPASAGDLRDVSSIPGPWVKKIPWRRKGQPTPVFLPGELHGQRSLAGCSLWGCKDSDTTERLSTHMHMYTLTSICFFPGRMLENQTPGAVCPMKSLMETVL